MEVKSGFKQTEVGEIPVDWNIHTIGETLQLVNGRAFKGEDWKEHGLPIIRIQNLNDTASSFNYYIGWVEDKHRIEAGDLLFAWSGTTGTSFGARIWNGPAGVLNQHIFKVLPDEDKVTPRYAFLALLKAQEDIVKRAHGFKASFVHVKKSDLVRIQLPLPSTKAEQEAIAAALSDADVLIESLEQLIAKKRQIKRGAMQELLTGKRRLPGFGGGDWKTSEIGSIPADWLFNEIGHFADVKTGPFGSSLHERDYVDDGTPIITVEHLGERGIIHADLPMVSDADCKRLAAYRLEEGDIVFSRVGSVDRNARVTAAESGWLFSGRLLRVRTSWGDVDSRYLSYQFHSEPFKQRVRTVAVGQTMASLNTQILKKVVVPLPPRTEQMAIATVLFDMDIEIAASEIRLAKASQIKQGMMQELLTGRIRLP